METACPNCSKRFAVPPAAAGYPIRCECGTEFTAPRPTSAPAARQPSAPPPLPRAPASATEDDEPPAARTGAQFAPMLWVAAWGAAALGFVIALGGLGRPMLYVSAHAQWGALLLLFALFLQREAR